MDSSTSDQEYKREWEKGMVWVCRYLPERNKEGQKSELGLRIHEC